MAQLSGRHLAIVEAAAKAARAARNAEKKLRREARERAFGNKILALPEQRYGVIVADPEWKFKPYNEDTGSDRAAANHYNTSSTEIIASRDVRSIAATNCVLFLWATVPMLPDALTVMQAWGFTYKSHFIWHKSRMGTGYWNRNKHELLLVGTRGRVPAPAPGSQYPSVISGTVRRHSEKPNAFLFMIEEFFPNTPKIELNRRGPARPGWDCWGYEAIAAE